MRVGDSFGKVRCSGVYSVARRSILAEIVVRDTCVTFRRASLLELGDHTSLFAPAQETEENRSSFAGLDRPSKHLIALRYSRRLSKENKNSPNEAQGGKYYEGSEISTLSIK